ncbi:glycosyltransferase [bacterium]|nr:glycosyltransferase [bacterium]
MKITVITVCLNSEKTIKKTIISVISQDYRNIEYIIIDGGSSDGTVETINKYGNKISKFVSEPDKGYYDAMNKGLKMANGEIIGFLHADDFYANKSVIKNVVKIFIKEKINCLWGDLTYVKKEHPEKVVRYWKAGTCTEQSFKKGWMPPHPAFFVKKWVYEKYGNFNTDFKISADYELMLRFLLKHKISPTYYMPEVLVIMRTGGASNKSLSNIFTKSKEDYKAWKIHGFKGGIGMLIMKNIQKIPQFFIREKPDICKSNLAPEIST